MPAEPTAEHNPHVPADEPPPIPPAPPPAAIDYRAPGVPNRSQWYTDQHAYGAAMVYGLLGLTVLGSFVGGVWWLVSHILGLYFGW